MQVATQKKMQIGQLLLKRGVVTAEQIDMAVEEQKRIGRSKLLGEVMVGMGICTENQISSALAEAYDVPYAQVTPKLCDPAIVEILPREFLEEYTVLPLFKVHDVLTASMSDSPARGVTYVRNDVTPPNAASRVVARKPEDACPRSSRST